MWSDRCHLVFSCPQDPVPSANVSYWKPGLAHDREKELLRGCRHCSWPSWVLPLRGELVLAGVAHDQSGRHSFQLLNEMETERAADSHTEEVEEVVLILFYLWFS